MSLFEKVDKHRELVNGMADRLGVDFGAKVAADPALAAQYRAAILTCTACRDVGECQGWQASHEHTEETPEYCRNKGLLETLASER